MSIAKNIETVKRALPDNVKLIAVSKTKPNQDILDAYNTGHKVFGENRVAELIEKSNILPKDIEWHMIGHLQSKKTKAIAPFIDYIHSVDSLKLLNTINKEAQKHNRAINVLLQVHIAQEANKFGFSENEILSLLNSSDYNCLENVKVRGLMGMATFTTNSNQIRTEFKKLKEIFDKIKNQLNPPIFTEISMGMSGDYIEAIAEGATHIRIGTGIFGKRK